MSRMLWVWGESNAGELNGNAAELPHPSMDSRAAGHHHHIAILILSSVLPSFFCQFVTIPLFLFFLFLFLFFFAQK